MVDLQVVIPSRRRAETCRHALTLVPDAIVSVAESEVPDYRDLPLTRPLLVHPDSVTGVAAVRRWVLETVPNQCVIIFDDDVMKVSCLVGRSPREITDPVAIARILENTAEIAAGIGAPLFSYAITANILEFRPWDPFGFIKVNGPCLGFVGRRILPDLALHHNTDCDLTLQTMLVGRYAWQDTRFMFEHRIMTNVGGNRHMISEETWAQDRRYLARKWGAYVEDQVSGEVSRMVVKNIVRRQRVD